MIEFILITIAQLKDNWILLISVFALFMLLYWAMKDKVKTIDKGRSFSVSKARILHSVIGLALFSCLNSYSFLYDWPMWLKIVIISIFVPIVAYFLINITSKIIIGEHGLWHINLFEKKFANYSKIQTIEKLIDSFGDGMNSVHVGYKLESGKLVPIDHFTNSGELIDIISKKSNAEITKANLLEFYKIANRASKPLWVVEILKISFFTILVAIAITNWIKFCKI